MSTPDGLLYQSQMEYYINPRWITISIPDGVLYQSQMEYYINPRWITLEAI
jgi:hypothetical protein